MSATYFDHDEFSRRSKEAQQLLVVISAQTKENPPKEKKYLDAKNPKDLGGALTSVIANTLTSKNCPEDFISLSSLILGEEAKRKLSELESRKNFESHAKGYMTDIQLYDTLSFLVQTFFTSEGKLNPALFSLVPKVYEITSEDLNRMSENLPFDIVSAVMKALLFRFLDSTFSTIVDQKLVFGHNTTEQMLSEKEKIAIGKVKESVKKAREDALGKFSSLDALIAFSTTYTQLKTAIQTLLSGIQASSPADKTKEKIGKLVTQDLPAWKMAASLIKLSKLYASELETQLQSLQKVFQEIQKFGVVAEEKPTFMERFRSRSATLISRRSSTSVTPTTPRGPSAPEILYHPITFPERERELRSFVFLVASEANSAVNTRPHSRTNLNQNDSKEEAFAGMESVV